MTIITHLRSGLAGLVLGGLAALGPAQAAPFPVTPQDPGSVFGTNGAATVTITETTLRPSGIGVRAGGFALSAAPLGNFIAWCLDIGTYLRVPSNYRITDTPFADTSGAMSAAQTGGVQRLFDTGFAGLDLGSNVDSAAFQLALWTAFYDPGSTSLAAGAFTATAANATGTAAIARAEELLATAADPLAVITQRWTLTFLESADTLNGKHKSQNLVTASPIPLPAGILLLLGGLGAFGLVARRRRALS